MLVFLITGKLLKYYQSVFCFVKKWIWIGQYDPFHTINDKFYFVFKELCCLWVLSPRIWNVLWMCFSKMNLLHQLKKMERWPRDTQKVIFLFYFWVENMLSPNILDCPLNPTLNYWYLRLPFTQRFRVGSVVIPKKKDVLVRIRSNYLFYYYYYFLWFFDVYQKSFG